MTKLIALNLKFRVLLHLAAIPLPLFLGYGGVTLLGVPMAFSHAALAVWLVSSGFAERRDPSRAASVATPSLSAS